MFNSPATTQTITGLTNGTSYSFTIAATNEIGTSDDSPPSNAATPRTVPGAPYAIGTTAGDGKITVSWSAPSIDGGSPITGYRVTPYISGAVQTPLTFTSATTAQTITGLKNATTYTFTVAAINAAGASAPSSQSSPTTPQGPYRPFASWDDFAARQLADFTGTPGTTASRAAAVSDLAAGVQTPAGFTATQMANSWYAPNVAPTARLYWAYFGRIPDYSGMTYWAGKRRTGTSLSTVSQNFAGSNEFKTKYGSLSNRAFVTRIYTDVLGRTADKAGVDYWTKTLDTKAKNRGQVMVGFSESSEYIRKTSTRVDTVMVYAGMLRRSPTASELEAGTAMTSTALIESIRISAPYAARIRGL
jgi:hypothetical protein